MSRSAIDATRFTATSPHAYSKSSILRSVASKPSPPTSISRSHLQSRHVPPSSPRGSGNSTETPMEKVARLRAQHAAMKQMKISTWDKIVVRGRVWADIAHKATVYTLVLLSVLSVGVTVFALGDMIIYNRRKRNAFYAEQHMLLQKRLHEAREAAAKGIADEDQTLLLNREQAREEADAARQASKGVLGYIKMFFSSEGLRKEEGESALDLLGEEGLRKMSQETSESRPAEFVKDVEMGQEQLGKGDILKAVEEKRRDGERGLEGTGVEGGPLDKMANKTAEAVQSKGGWTSWLTSK